VLALVLVGLTVTFLLFVLPFASMPDVRKTPWQELARGVVEGDEGAHEPADPYFILGTNETLPSAVAALKSRVTSQGWRVYQDPNPFGGLTFNRPDDPEGGVLVFESLANRTSRKFGGENLQDYSVSTEQLREWQTRYTNIDILEMVFG
jgi:hypothetical protein